MKYIKKEIPQFLFEGEGVFTTDNQRLALSEHAKKQLLKNGIKEMDRVQGTKLLATVKMGIEKIEVFQFVNKVEEIGRNIDIDAVQEILKGKLSNNKSRFDSSNGIVFSINSLTDEIESYLSNRGIEFYSLVNGIYYTETVMSVTEFSKLDYITHYKHVA